LADRRCFQTGPSLLPWAARGKRWAIAGWCWRCFGESGACGLELCSCLSACPSSKLGRVEQEGANGLLLRRLDNSTASFPLRRIHVASSGVGSEGKIHSDGGQGEQQGQQPKPRRGLNKKISPLPRLSSHPPACKSVTPSSKECCCRRGMHWCCCAWNWTWGWSPGNAVLARLIGGGLDKLVSPPIQRSLSLA